MNDRCVRCGGEGTYPIRALEVRTLHVRSLGGEKRVQALGNEIQGTVCERCARERLALSADPVRAAKPQLISFGIVLVAGLAIEAVSFLFLKGQRIFPLLGIAAMICGVLGIADAMKKAKEKSQSLRALPEAEALEEAAWDVFTARAPKKEGDNDLTYIPVNEKTLARKNGDLMILYRLLPDIAVQAWKRLHEPAKESPAHGYRFHGWQTADVKDPRGLTPRDYYDVLSGIWCAETCAPRMRSDWNVENRTLGQCSVTAFLMQDIYGGKVYGVPLEDGSFHCFNDVDGCVFDLTSEQFGNRALDYENCPEQFREVHFAKEEKRLRYELLKSLLEKALDK